MIKYLLLGVAFGSLGLLMACASPKSNGGYYKVGQSYKIDGKWYHPEIDNDYDEKGVASWYGPQFHGKKTANGDVFDKNALTAAHKTLPLPSMVRVTNLENGRTMILMVNDRGPFSNDRIIDVSERASEILGFRKKGLAKVRVQYLKGQTRRLHADLYNSGETMPKPNNVAYTRIKDVEPIEAPGLAPINSNALPTSLPELNTSSAPVTAEIEPESIPYSRSTLSSDVAPVDITIPQNFKVAKSMYEEPKLEPEAGGNPYFIQVGAFSNQQNATDVVDDLSILGAAQVVPVETSNRVLYRVRLGPISSESLANDILTRIHDYGHEAATIVQDQS